MFNKKRIVIFVVFIALMFFLTTFAGAPAEIAKVATRDVIFTDSFDGINISEQKVVVGTNATVPATPKHQNIVFSGWYDYLDHDREVTNFERVTEDIHVVALYDPDINNNGIPDDKDVYYNVIFMDGVNSKELKREKVLEGLDATAPIEPVHPNYEFLGWDQDYAGIKSDMTVTATYRFTGNNNPNNPNPNPNPNPEPQPTMYTVTFVDGDTNKTISKANVAEGKSATAPTPPTHEDRLFDKWDGEYTNVTSNRTVTAVYTDNKNHNDEKDYLEEHFNITFASEGKGELKGETSYTGILVGLTFEEAGIEIPEVAPNKYYKALDWDPTIVTTVEGNADYLIKFVPINDELSENGGPDKVADEEHEYKLVIKHVFDDEKVTLEDSVYKRDYDNRDYEITVDPVEFYDNEPAKVVGTIGEPDKKTTKYETVNYTRKTFHVKFVDEDGKTILKEEDVKAEEAATAPTVPDKIVSEKTVKVFKAWDKDFDRIVEDTTITASYEETVRKYKVKFVDEDGTTVIKDTKEYEYNTKPKDIDVPEDPTKEADEMYTYTFDKWDPKLSKVTEDVTYKATYKAKDRKYTITWKNYDGTTLATDNVKYGKTPEYEGETPVKKGTGQYSYVFAGWTPEVKPVNGDATYTAEFTEVENKYTVTWKNEDGTVLATDKEVPYGTMPTYTGKEPTKEKTPEFTYTFDKWTPELEEVKGDVTYTATFTKVTNKYKVTFVDEDGKVLKEETEYEYGTKAADIAKPEDPTKERTPQYTYTFAGWTPEVEDVTKDVTYKATYKETVNKYTVTWKNYDGKVLETDRGVEYGATPKYDGIKPHKPGTQQYTYKYAGWDPEIKPVEGNVTYTATFTEVVNQYTVTWKNYDGKVLETDENVDYGTLPTYNGKTPTKPSTPEFTYTFDKWTPEVAEVEGDVTYKATFTETKNKYEVTFIDEDGKVLKETTEYEYGTKASDIVKPKDPVKEGDAHYSYTFAGWNPKVNDVTEDVKYKATYKQSVNKYTVTWKNADGTLLEEDKDVEYGVRPSYDGEKPTQEPTVSTVYTFAGWDEEITPVEGNVTYTATYNEAVRTYKVTFVDHDDKVLKETQTVEYNKAATAPANPTRENWTFTGWDKAFDHVQSDLTVKATYKANQIGIKVEEKPNVNWVFQKGQTADLKALIDVYEVYADGSKKETVNYTDDFSTANLGEFTLTITENGFTDKTIKYKVQNEEAAQTKFEVRMSVNNTYKKSNDSCTRNCTSSSNTTDVTLPYNFLEVIEHYDEYITVKKVEVKYKDNSEEQLNFGDTVRWTKKECNRYGWLGQCTNYSTYDPVRIASSTRMSDKDRTDLYERHEIDKGYNYPEGAVSTSNRALTGKCSEKHGCAYMIPATLPLKASGVTYYELNSDKNGFTNTTVTKLTADVQDATHQIDTVTVTYYRESDDSTIAGNYKVVFRYTPAAEKEFTAIDEYKI